MAKVLIPIEVPDTYNADEVAGILGCGIATVWRWIKHDKIFVVRLGGRTLIPKSEIERLKNDRATGNPSR